NKGGATGDRRSRGGRFASKTKGRQPVGPEKNRSHPNGQLPPRCADRLSFSLPAEGRERNQRNAVSRVLRMEVIAMPLEFSFPRRVVSGKPGQDAEDAPSDLTLVLPGRALPRLHRRPGHETSPRDSIPENGPQRDTAPILYWRPVIAAAVIAL